MTEITIDIHAPHIAKHCAEHGRLAIDFIKKYPICMISVMIAFVFALLAFDYMDCVSITCWTVTFWDALFDGRILEFSDVTYENLRGAPHGGQAGGFLAILPWAIWNLPIWIAHPTPGDYNLDNPACMIWSRLFLIAVLYLTSYYVMRLSYIVSKDKNASEYSFLLCFTAGTAIISVGYAGQDEVVYMAAFLGSIYYYFKNHKIISTCLMIFALGCFPILVIPLFMILLVRNIPVIKSLIIAGIQALIGMYLFGVGGASTSYGSTSTYIDWFFYRTQIVSAEGSISFFMVSITVILLYCIFKKKKDTINASIICMALFFMSMLLFSWMHFYRYFVCIPAIILAIMTLYQSNNNLYKIGLILFVGINYATCVVACLDVNCWDYRYFSGYLSEFFTMNYADNFLYLLFKENTRAYSQLILSALLMVCAFLSYVLIKKPAEYKEINISERKIVIVSTLCPLALAVAYMLVPYIS